MHTAYAVYQGTLGAFTTHAIFGGVCGLPATTLTNQAPCAGSCYYLVSPVDDVAARGKSRSQLIGRRDSPPCDHVRAAVDLVSCN
jgi:hypothetical protein